MLNNKLTSLALRCLIGQSDRPFFEDQHQIPDHRVSADDNQQLMRWSSSFMFFYSLWFGWFLLVGLNKQFF